MPVPSRSIVVGSGVAAGDGEPPGPNEGAAAVPGSARTTPAVPDDGGASAAAAGAGALELPPSPPPLLGGLGADGVGAGAGRGAELTAGVFALVVNDVVVFA